MKRVLSFGIFLLAALSVGQVKLKVSQNGQMIGRVTVSSRLSKNGEKVDEMSMSRTENGKTVDIRLYSSFAPDGTPVRKFMAISLAGTSERHQALATFSSAGATVQTLPATGTSTAVVPFPVGRQIKQLDEFWFVRDDPAPGTTLESSSFDLSARMWRDRRVTYQGITEVLLGGKQRRAHKVTSVMGDQSSTQYLDELGLPLRIEQGNLVFERIMP